MINLCPEDVIIIQTISLIANRHNCKITNINIDFDINSNQKIGTIEIDGSEEKKLVLSQAIDNMLKNKL